MRLCLWRVYFVPGPFQLLQLPIHLDMNSFYHILPPPWYSASPPAQYTNQSWTGTMSQETVIPVKTFFSIICHSRRQSISFFSTRDEAAWLCLPIWLSALAQIASTAWCQGWTTKSLSLYISWETQESTERSERLQNFPQTSVLLTSAVNFTHPRVHPRRKSELRDYPYHIGLCVCLQGNDFIAQSTVGSTIPWASGHSLYKKAS